MASLDNGVDGVQARHGICSGGPQDQDTCKIGVENLWCPPTYVAHV